MLKRNSTGQEVVVLKKELTRIGWGQTDSNLFDLETEAAIFNLQKSKGLVVDGIVGPKTLEALSKTPNNPNKITPIKTLCKRNNAVVPYFSQRDNVNSPGGTCNVTSLAMVLTFLGLKPKDPKKQLEDELYELLDSKESRDYLKKHFPELAGYKPWVVHGMLSWAAQQMGFKAEFKYQTTLQELRAQLEKNLPLIIAGNFTSAGHIVVLVGETASGDFIVNDPWGDWFNDYSTKDGDHRIYPFEKVWPILKPEGSKKLAHFIAK